MDTPTAEEAEQGRDQKEEKRQHKANEEHTGNVSMLIVGKTLVLVGTPHPHNSTPPGHSGPSQHSNPDSGVRGHTQPGL